MGMCMDMSPFYIYKFMDIFTKMQKSPPANAKIHKKKAAV